MAQMLDKLVWIERQRKLDWAAHIALFDEFTYWKEHVKQLDNENGEQWDSGNNLAGMVVRNTEHHESMKENFATLEQFLLDVVLEILTTWRDSNPAIPMINLRDYFEAYMTPLGEEE